MPPLFWYSVALFLFPSPFLLRLALVYASSGCLFCSLWRFFLRKWQFIRGWVVSPMQILELPSLGSFSFLLPFLMSGIFCSARYLAYGFSAFSFLRYAWRVSRSGCFSVGGGEGGSVHIVGACSSWQACFFLLCGFFAAYWSVTGGYNVLLGTLSQA